MKGKIALILTATVIVAMILAPQVKASTSPPPSIYGYSDKVLYGPGDSGSMKFWIFNPSLTTITLKNITIWFPWYVSGSTFGGNYTIKDLSVTLSTGQNYSFTQSFTIPNDGRVNGRGDYANVTAGYQYSLTAGVTSSDFRSNPYAAQFYFVAYPDPISIEGFQTLMMVNIIVILIAAIIIAIAIVMTKRSPHGTPQPPQ